MTTDHDLGVRILSGAPKIIEVWNMTSLKKNKANYSSSYSQSSVHSRNSEHIRIGTNVLSFESFLPSSSRDKRRLDVLHPANRRVLFHSKIEKNWVCSRGEKKNGETSWKSPRRVSTRQNTCEWFQSMWATPALSLREALTKWLPSLSTDYPCRVRLMQVLQFVRELHEVRFCCNLRSTYHPLNIEYSLFT